MTYIEMRSSYKRYKSGQSEMIANNDISSEIERGELAVVLSSSRVGKSAIPNILSGVDTNGEENVLIDGRDISIFNEKELINYRRSGVGPMLQFYNPVPNLTAKENAELASKIVKDTLDTTEVLQLVGLGEGIDNFSARLSGGEQQRVAIAHAAAKNPKLLLRDELMGVLDYNTGRQALKILRDVVRKEGVTVIIVTHNQAPAPIADRAVHMHDTKIHNIELNSNPQNIETLGC